MAGTRHGESHEDPEQPWPALGDPAEALPDPDEVDNQAMPGYLTLEIDVSDLGAVVADAGTEVPPTDGSLPEFTAPGLEAADLQLLEALELEELSFPGYLTLEVDLETLENESPEPGEGT